MSDSDFPKWHRALNKVIRRVAPLPGRLFPDLFAKRLKRPIFVFGCHRSGTTLTGRLIDLHRDVANWTEANEIWDPGWYPWCPQLQDKYYPIEYDWRAFIARWEAENQGRHKEIRAILGAYQTIWGKPFFLNKNPNHVFRLPYLRQFYPEAKLIYIIRDGRAVVESHVSKLYREGLIKEWPRDKRKLFAENREELAVWLSGYWKECIEEVKRQDAALGLTQNGIMITVRYEDIIADRFAVMYRICDFVGLDRSRFMPNALENITVSDNNNKWRKMPPETIKKIEDVIGPQLAQLQYI